MVPFNNEKIKREIKNSNEIFLSFKNIFSPNKEFHPKSISLEITSIFIIIGCFLIFFTNILFSEWISNNKILFYFDHLKEWYYLVMCSFILYFLIRFHTHRTDLLHNNHLLQYEKLYKDFEKSSSTEMDLKQQIESLKEDYKTLKIIEGRYRLAIEGANDAIWDWDIQGKNTYFFTRTKKLLGYEDHEIENNIDALKSLIDPQDLPVMTKSLKDHMECRSEYYQIEYRMITKAGDYKWIQSGGKAVFDESGQPIRMTGSHKDITHQKKAEEEIYSLAYYDALTGLPNRTLFEEKLSDALEDAKMNSDKVSLLYFDLDNFKNVNDTLGHIFGDLLLKSVGELLQRCLGDMAIVSRLGGDEFVVLLPKISDLDEVTMMVEKIITAFQNPWILDDREFYITPSIGVTIFPDHGKNTHDLMKNADTAMYHAKDKGKNNYHFYSPDMNKKILEKLELENSLRHAVEREDFVVYYQPLIDFFTGKIVGVEALIRWLHPTSGLVSPGLFIPLVEESGLIIPIGEWVFRSACKQHKKWMELGYPPLRLSINLSARQFQQDHLVERILNILQETGMDPNFLELEITETLAMQDLDLTIYTLDKLRKLGIKISLDDFGTGYSSLNYLKKLPIDTLKMDKSFVQGITKDSDEEAIANAVMTLAHRMDLKVTAEGIETWEQFEFLKNLHCDKAQGFLFSRPLPPSEIENLISQNKTFL